MNSYTRVFRVLDLRDGCTVGTMRASGFGKASADVGSTNLFDGATTTRVDWRIGRFEITTEEVDVSHISVVGES